MVQERQDGGVRDAKGGGLVHCRRVVALGDRGLNLRHKHVNNFRGRQRFGTLSALSPFT
jgi:hypothetical protein